jgi:lipopolysaccharide biosynthesis glycosyltransferase
LTTFDVACAVEGAAYAAHSAAMLDSLLERNHHDDVRIHYLPGPGIGADDERKLAEMVTRRGASIDFVRVEDERLRGLPTEGFTRAATWYRIFLPELLPDVDRLLYLDADLLVLESVAPLWELDLRDHYLAAVTNVLEPIYADRPARLGIEGENRYFNAGVLLMNLDLMRRERCTQALEEYAREHAAELMWRDQDALNVVLGGRRLPLHPRWNCMNAIVLFPQASEVFEPDELAEARAQPAIRHFEGPAENKPWHYLCAQSMRELYFEHRRRTPWPRVRREGVTARNVLRRAGLARRGPGHTLADR